MLVTLGFVPCQQQGDAAEGRRHLDFLLAEEALETPDRERAERSRRLRELSIREKKVELRRTAAKFQLDRDWSAVCPSVAELCLKLKEEAFPPAFQSID